MSIVPETVGKGDIGINLNALGTVTSLPRSPSGPRSAVT